MKPNWRRGTRTMGVVTLLGVLGTGAAAATAHEPCEVRLTAEFTPDLMDAGPGPEYRCENVIETMRKDGRVVSVHVDSTAALADAEVNEPISPGESSGAHGSELGLGALYWAVHHPRHAWRILLPIQPSDAAPEETSSHEGEQGHEVSGRVQDAESQLSIP